ncbi:hypothetical protein ZTR_04734 [Talaromyces verruculosus]|nr:hypothetical protein ZTR_04734 [Talaromyces verruculosus]
MAFRWIVNAGLIAIPIGSTLELGVTLSRYCNLTLGILPPSKGGLNYSLNPNQWGVVAAGGTDADSQMCMNVTTFLNETYPTKTSAPEWSVTWQYTPFPESQPVHAYPNIEVHDGLPVTLSDLKSLNIDVAWSYSLGNTPKDTSDTPEFDSISLNTNVAIDMFFDSLEKNATDSTMAEYEIMVWFAHYGVAAQSIGNASGIVDTQVVNTTTFNLYYGNHTVGQSVLQHVYTWVASEDTTSFTGDISPLITALTSKTGTRYPSTSDYMGIFGFGSEAYYADQNVTFYVPKLDVDIQT